MSYSEKENMWGWYALVAAAALAALFANTIVTDNNGLSSNHHVEALPAQVIQLNESTYLVESGADAPQANEICRGDSGDADDSPLATAVSIPKLDDMTFIQCDQDQVWNAQNQVSPNFGDAMISTLRNPWWIYPTIGAFLLASIWPLSIAIPARRRRRFERQRAKMDLEQARKELVKGWAEDTIDDLAFNKKMDALYAKGLPAATD